MFSDYGPVWIWLTFELMQINKLLCIIHKLVKVVYEKTAYEYTILLVGTYELTVKLVHLHKLFFTSSN